MTPLRAPGRKAIVLKPTRPNAGIEALYRAKLSALVDEMNTSLSHWLLAAYRPAAGAVIGQDEAPVTSLRAAVRNLSQRWQRRFDAGAPALAEWFGKRSTGQADTTLTQTLRDAGFSVRFKLTDEARAAYQAVVAENVGLIKSIASQHLSDVEGIMMRAVQTGVDPGDLSAQLVARYGVTRRRAASIALDQNNKATAVIVRVRQDQLGLTQAKWKHSHAGVHPRPEHLAADGKIYEIKKGMYLEGKWTWPGHEIKCRCVSQSVIPGIDF